MASPVNVALCALLATAYWTLLGFALGGRLLPRPLAVGAAPVLGWAVQSAATLPLFFLIGFSRLTVVGAAVLCLLVGGACWYAGPAADRREKAAIPLWAFAAAALLALAPTAAILPKFAADAVSLAAPIYDHSKIAMIDAMTRQGLPPINPFFGAAGTGRLAYYYLWHFSAAEVAAALGASGWEADAGLTWFTAAASLALMMGLAVWLSKRSAAAICVVLLAGAASLRAVLDFIFGPAELRRVLADPTGFAGWLFQSAWVPQHLMSASCVVLTMLLVACYAQRRSFGLLLIIVLTLVAGFESSAYVGGVTCALAALAAAPALLLGIERGRRLQFIMAMSVAGLLAIGLAAPFVSDQIAAVGLRGGGAPIAIEPAGVLGALWPPPLRRVLDLPAFWLILLPIEFPAAYLAGTMAMIALLRGAGPGPEKTALAAAASLAGAALAASWLLVSKIGEVNDLGLRAVLPGLLVLIAAAAAGMFVVPRRALIAAAAFGGLVLSLPGATALVHRYVAGAPGPDGKIFAQSPALWEAVRRYAAPTARIANNPQFVQAMTPWPVNISWALLADRSSCFAGRELTLAYTALPQAQREAINAQFVRMFAAEGTPADVAALAQYYGCDVVVVVPQDKAWEHDPFASSTDYRLAESRDDRWRIYVRR